MLIGVRMKGTCNEGNLPQNTRIGVTGGNNRRETKNSAGSGIHIF